VIHPDLLYQLWKQENDERLRVAAHWQAIRQARLTRMAGRSRAARASTSAEKNWLILLGDGVLRLRRLWTTSRTNHQPVGESLISRHTGGRC
jgi:hypothetical protein